MNQPTNAKPHMRDEGGRGAQVYGGTARGKQPGAVAAAYAATPDNKHRAPDAQSGQ